MRFTVEPELQLFAESMRGALGGWEAPREPVFGEWWDERDDALAERLRVIGWDALWEHPTLLGVAVAGGIELGRSVAPICLVDEATLGGPVAVGGRIRHGEGRVEAAVIDRYGVHLMAVGDSVREATLDGSGTVRASLLGGPVSDGEARFSAWSVATVAYLAGLVDVTLDGAVGYARSREQFGRALATLPTMQARLADAALERDGLQLVAWSLAAIDDGSVIPYAEALTWASRTARELTASVQQVFGGVGFALETGIHRAYRRAKSLQVWTEAVVQETMWTPLTSE